MSRVSIVDYGAGNLLSVGRAFEKCGSEVSLVTTAADVLAADILVLPGVGAFRDGMQGLAKAGLDEAIVRYADTGRPFLGICLGMQMLATDSEEFGIHKGLGLIPGHVKAIAPCDDTGQPHKVPYVGWADLEPAGRSGFAHSPLTGMAAGQSVYLVHSYHCMPNNPAHLLAVYRYGGVPTAAAVWKDNIVGCQFHPEKSGTVGLSVIKGFLAGWS